MRHTSTGILLTLHVFVVGVLSLLFCLNSSFAELPNLTSTKDRIHPSTANLKAHWNYLGIDGPRHWAMLTPEYMTCETGRQQSPIHITMPSPSRHHETLTFHYQTSQLHEMNNGHTIQVSHVSGCRVDLNQRAYQLRQFHFHDPSEHHIDGKTYPMEMHLVHQDDRGQTLVIAVMLTVGEKTPVLSPLWKWLPDQVGKEVDIPLEFRIGDLIPVHSRHYTYSGSLTTPPCTEGVKWIVLEQPIPVSQEDIDQFVKIIGKNARPIQPLGNRPILEE